MAAVPQPASATAVTAATSTPKRTERFMTSFLQRWGYGSVSWGRADRSVPHPTQLREPYRGTRGRTGPLRAGTDVRAARAVRPASGQPCHGNGQREQQRGPEDG